MKLCKTFVIDEVVDYTELMKLFTELEIKQEDVRSGENCETVVVGAGEENHIKFCLYLHNKYLERMRAMRTQMKLSLNKEG